MTRSCAYYVGHVGLAGSKIVSCREPVAFRCVLSWTPLVDHHCCTWHRPRDAEKYLWIGYVGDGSLGGTVVPIEAARAARLKKQAK